MLINFYLMEKDDYEAWKEGEEFEYIQKLKQKDNGEGMAILGDGEYCFVFNNAIEDEEVEIDFEAQVEWEETVLIKGTRTRYELHIPIMVSSLVTIVCFVTSYAIKYPHHFVSVSVKLIEQLRRIVLTLKGRLGEEKQR